MERRNQRRVVIVGGGAAGLLAAWQAVAQGVRVVVLDRLPEVGRKLSATGGGRGNLGNTADVESFMAAFGRSGRFLQPALAFFGMPGLRSTLRSVGLALHSPDGFHLYPASGSAREIRDALYQALVRQGVTFHGASPATALRVQDGRCCGVEGEDGLRIDADAVVLATGGAAMPRLGSNGSGYRLARAVGHAVRGPWPALVPLVTAEPWGHALAGVSLPDVSLRMDRGGRRGIEARGALLFTHRGLSGPLALNASGDLSEALDRDHGEPLRLNVSLRPERTPASWQRQVDSWRATSGARSAVSLLGGMLPRSVAKIVAELAEVGERPCARWSKEAMTRWVETVSALPFTLTGTEGFDAAMATRGGVVLKEVDPKTLASRVLPGLFFAGELLDLDGPCGGYNLLWAFSSGALAGHHAAQATASQLGISPRDERPPRADAGSPARRA